MVNITSLIQELWNNPKTVKLGEALQLVQQELDKLGSESRNFSSTVPGLIAAQLPPSDLTTPPGNVHITGTTVIVLPANDFGYQVYQVTSAYDPPKPLGSFRKVRVFVRAQGDSGSPQQVAVCEYNGISGSASWGMVPTATSITYDYWLASSSTTIDNQLDVAATPHGIFTLGPISPDQLGKERCLPVTNLHLISGPGQTMNASGVYRTNWRIGWTNPTDAKFGGAEVVIQYPGPVYRPISEYSIISGSLTAPGSVVDLYIFDQTIPSASAPISIWTRTYDKQGRRNSLAGVCPFVASVCGTTLGQLDLSKALTSSIGSALGVVNNVLGVQPYGITEALIGQFAVSQQKLDYAPIIDSIRIVNAAVTTAKIQNLAIVNALIANAAITQAKIGDLEVTSAKILSLAMEKLTAGTITAGSGGISITGTGGLSILGGGGISVSVGIVGIGGDLFAGRIGIHGPGVFVYAIGNNAYINAYNINVSSQLTSAWIRSNGSLLGQTVYGDNFNASTGGLYPGLNGTRTVKDGAGNNKTVTLHSGLVTAWDT